MSKVCPGPSHRFKPSQSQQTDYLEIISCFPQMKPKASQKPKVESHKEDFLKLGVPEEEQTGDRDRNYGTGIGLDLLAKHKLFFCLLLILAGQKAKAQSHEHGQEDHEQHVHPKNEIAVANSMVYMGGEDEFAYGLHLHYIRSIKESRFGYGLGYEQIFDDHLHRNIGIVGSFRLVHSLILNVAPGITFIGGENAEKTFALHVEANYEFEIGDFHIGPLLEYAYSGHGYHISIGLHLAYTF